VPREIVRKGVVGMRKRRAVASFPALMIALNSGLTVYWVCRIYWGAAELGSPGMALMAAASVFHALLAAYWWASEPRASAWTEP
jgi:uncharacterized membrane protein HdeD (DUF308 family)